MTRNLKPKHGLAPSWGGGVSAIETITPISGVSAIETSCHTKQRTKWKTGASFSGTVPGTATLGEGAGSWGCLGGSQGFSARRRETPAQARPHPGKVPARASTIAPAPIAPREVLTSGAEPQAGSTSPRCHTRHGRAAQGAEKKETPAAEA